MKQISAHSKALAIALGLLFVFAHSASTFHTLFSECSHQKAPLLELTHSDSPTSDDAFSHQLSEWEAEQLVVDCVLCEFTFQQISFAEQGFRFLVKKPLEAPAPHFALWLHPKQCFANESLRGPPTASLQS